MSTETVNAIATIVETNPALVLVDEKKFEDFYEHVKAEAAATPIDLSTDKGRKAIASMAHKIARTKTAIDEAGKKLNEEARAKINAVDEARRKIRERFDALKEDVRRPLTEWEEAEVERIGKVDRFFGRMAEYCKVSLDDTAQAVKDRYESLTLVKVDEAVFQDRHADAVEAQDRALSVLKDAFERLTREEEERAELARLRREQEEREAAEAQRCAEEERKAQQRDYAKRVIDHIKQCGLGMIDGQTYPYPILFRELEEKVVIDESFGDLAGEAEQARQDALAKLRAGMEADRKAEQERIEREARERADAEAKARIEAAERAAREAEEAAARKIEEDRLAREREKAEQERKEREAREAEAARQADREHRAKIMGAAKAAIIEIGIEETKAKEIVLAIAAGNIPHISIRF